MEYPAGAHQLPGDKDCAHRLGDQRGDGNAHDAHVKEDYKGCVQNDVYNAADDQDIEGAL